MRLPSAAALLISLSLFPGQAARAFESPAFEPSAFEKELIDVLSGLETAAAGAAEIPLRAPVDRVLPELEAAFGDMRARAEAQADARIARPAVAITARAMMQLGFAAEAGRWAGRQIESRFGACADFSECNSLVRDLADLADVAPKAVLRAVDSRLRPLARGLTLALSASSRRPYRDSLAQQALLYRLDSLAALCRFHADTGYLAKGRAGISPWAPPAKLKALSKLLSEVEIGYAHLQPPRPWEDEDPRDWRFRVDRFHAELARDLELDLAELAQGPPVSPASLELVAQDMALGLVRTRLGNQSLALYLERFNRADPGPWMSSVLSRVERGELDREAALMAFVRFLPAETRLPWGRDWVSRLGSLGADDDLVLAARAGLDEHERQTRELLEKQGLPRETLLAREKQLAARYPLFHSLAFQAAELARAQNDLARAALEAPDDRTALAAAHDDAVGLWLTTACYGAWAEGTVPPEKARIFFSDGDGYRLLEACPRPHARGPEQGVIRYVGRLRIDKIWKPVVTEALIMTAMIPLTVASGGVAGLAARPVAALTTRALGAAAARWALNRALSSAMVAVLPRIASAVAGAVAFTAIQRSVLTAITLGQMPLYERHKSFLGNYGKDLLMGSAIFFFLPYSAAFSNRLVESAGLAASATTRGQLAAVSIRAGMDTAIFTSLPYLEQAVKKAAGVDVPPNQSLGWGELPAQAIHAAALSLAFRLHGPSPAPRTPEARLRGP